ncbi:hypothetical protein Lalb_Chr05g0218051 [Lupinus albus]|uniref:Uncharacterized protein n=1 Tax=Lupinus albus TaxID=3870 RepID=A0A6A4QJA9_LUPAL|nr:hypothetical protein Lalb_Chr05g0218051 [Lupinus albus]
MQQNAIVILSKEKKNPHYKNSLLFLASYQDLILSPNTKAKKVNEIKEMINQTRMCVKSEAMQRKRKNNGLHNVNFGSSH